MIVYSFSPLCQKYITHARDSLYKSSIRAYIHFLPSSFWERFSSKKLSLGIVWGDYKKRPPLRGALSVLEQKLKLELVLEGKLGFPSVVSFIFTFVASPGFSVKVHVDVAKFYNSSQVFVNLIFVVKVDFESAVFIC